MYKNASRWEVFLLCPRFSSYGRGFLGEFKPQIFQMSGQTFACYNTASRDVHLLSSQSGATVPDSKEWIIGDVIVVARR